MKKKLFTLMTLLLCLCSGAWAEDITISPTLSANQTKFSYGLYTITHSSTASSNGSKISSSAITTGTNGDVITINFKTTKSDMYIKSVTFNSLSNGTLSSTDGSISNNVFSVTGNKNDVKVVLTSSSNSVKGSVKVTNVVVNTGNNSVETITFSSVSSGTISFTSKINNVSVTSAISSITTNGNASVSSNELSWPNSKTLVFTSSKNINYIALLDKNDKVYASSGFSASPATYADAAWNGTSKTVTFTNNTGGGRYILKAYVVTEVDAPHTVSFNAGDYGTYTGGDITEASAGAGITLPNLTTLATGYTFNGWYTASTGGTKAGNAGDAYTPSNDTELFAQYTANTYTVALNANGGTDNGSATATYDSNTLTSITAPTRDGYTLEGYYAETTCENKVATAAGALQPNTAYTNANSEWTSTSDEVSLYAKWEAVELANTTDSKTWKFDDTNITSGSKTAASSSTEYVYSSLSGMTFGANFDATALSFKGSYPYYSGGGQHISQGSQWKFHPTVDGRVKVSWYSAGGAEDTRYLSIGGTAAGSTNNTAVTSDAVAVSADADVVIAGYSDESLETAAYIDVTEIAFTATPYTLTYNSNGATNGSVPETAKKYAEGDEVTVLGNTGLLEKDGKTFAGWNTQADGLGTDYAADAVLTIGTADVTLYAKWASEYTVTHTLTNVTKTSGATTAYENTQYTAVFAANTNYDLPEAITVTAGGSNITASCTWTKATGTVVIPAAQVTGNIEITVTGVEHVAPTAGVIYSLTTNSASLSSVTLDTEVNLVPTYATISGGGAYLGNQNNSDNSKANKAQVDSSKGIYLGGNDAYIKLILNEPLKTGDVITFVNGDGTKQICFTTTATRATTNSTSSYSYTCAETFNDKSTIYIWRSEGSATYVKSLTITRNNSITLNNVSNAAYGFSTFCAPNNFTVTGATAYKASLDNGKLTLTALEGIIPANAGVILAADKGATASITYTSSAATADMDGNALGGTTARTLTATLKGDNTYFYAFQNTTNTFKQYNGEYFPANKAYVVSNAQLSRGISMDFGETTGISNVDVNANDNFDVNAPMYNLAGQKVGKSYKGIVIVNGKKVVRK